MKVSSSVFKAIIRNLPCFNGAVFVKGDSIIARTSFGYCEFIGKGDGSDPYYLTLRNDVLTPDDGSEVTIDKNSIVYIVDGVKRTYSPKTSWVSKNDDIDYFDFHYLTDKSVAIPPEFSDKCKFLSKYCTTDPLDQHIKYDVSKICIYSDSLLGMTNILCAYFVPKYDDDGKWRPDKNCLLKSHIRDLYDLFLESYKSWDIKVWESEPSHTNKAFYNFEERYGDLERYGYSRFLLPITVNLNDKPSVWTFGDLNNTFTYKITQEDVIFYVFASDKRCPVLKQMRVDFDEGCFSLYPEECKWISDTFCSGNNLDNSLVIFYNCDGYLALCRCDFLTLQNGDISERIGVTLRTNIPVKFDDAIIGSIKADVLKKIMISKSWSFYSKDSCIRLRDYDSGMNMIVMCCTAPADLPDFANAECKSIRKSVNGPVSIVESDHIKQVNSGILHCFDL